MTQILRREWKFILNAGDLERTLQVSVRRSLNLASCQLTLTMKLRASDGKSYLLEKVMPIGARMWVKYFPTHWAISS